MIKNINDEILVIDSNVDTDENPHIINKWVELIKDFIEN